MADTEVWTIGRLLTWTADFLRKRGADSPRLDAEVLLAHVRNCPRINLYADFGEIPPDGQRASFRELVKRRGDGAPVAYLVGYREFFSLTFQVSPAVLIPRPETELLVVELLDRLAACRESHPGSPPRVADVGTGSGIIAVCAARYSAECRVTRHRHQPGALAVAGENCRRHGVAERIELIEGDLLASLPAEPTFALVASNPPYITTAEMLALPRDVKDFEPHLALAGGERGTDVIARLIPQTAERLLPGGSLLLEISPMIDNDVRRLISADGRFELLPTKKDLAQHPRVVLATRKAATN